MSSSEIKHSGERFASRVFESADAIFKSQVPRKWVEVNWSGKMWVNAGKGYKVPLSFESEFEFFWEAIFFQILTPLDISLVWLWLRSKGATHLRIRRTAYFVPLDWLIEWAGDWDDEVLIAGLSARAILRIIFRIVPSCYGMKCPVRRKDMLDLLWICFQHMNAWIEFLYLGFRE